MRACKAGEGRSPFGRTRRRDYLMDLLLDAEADLEDI